MPKRTDIKSILIIGSGPIVIGQACEFDYSGSQACKVLRQDGYKIILVNSNPATIMTDPDMADRTYIEPITVEIIEKIIEKERPDALLPTLGGQTALNATIGLAEKGILKKYKVETIGANIKAIKKGEDRRLFKEAMQKIGLDLPRSDKAYNLNDACRAAEKIGFPLIIRPSFTMGGTGGSVAYNMEEFKTRAKIGLESSMISEILVEESVMGWKEFELEVMRDLKDNVVVICSIENFDPMGVHTGDSITVAPIQTLTDKEYQTMRNAAIACIREIGVETGGSNIQFAVHPETGRMVIIEMNPRVSRSSALASKATGFPIAKIAAKLAVGYTLDEIPNDITKETPACFEPSIDYCVVKIPRFTFEKFPLADPTLTVSMKSVGEAMSIGRTFKEALQKGLRSLEIKKSGLESILFTVAPSVIARRPKADEAISKSGIASAPTGPRNDEVMINEDILNTIYEKLRIPNAERIFYIGDALRAHIDINKIHEMTKIDRWFLHNIKEIVELEREVVNCKGNIGAELLNTAKQYGFSDHQLASLLGKDEAFVKDARKKYGLKPDFKLVDTCAAEFMAHTPYYYSTYDR
ncbi:MAG: carbamoyl-phosphate synthase large subunit [Candidatus Omnitrophota bacterium]|nr:carbamoyl-phosphate synthase large subunit [Candidatus Omnitrophota bacterium]